VSMLQRDSLEANLRTRNLCNDVGFFAQESVWDVARRIPDDICLPLDGREED
jgi:hypothetical protein